MTPEQILERRRIPSPGPMQQFPRNIPLAQFRLWLDGASIAEKSGAGSIVPPGF